MSVNIIKKDKQKLLSHVLNPKAVKKESHKSSTVVTTVELVDSRPRKIYEVVEEDEDEDEDEDYEPTTKKRRGKDSGSRKKGKSARRNPSVVSQVLVCQIMFLKRNSFLQKEEEDKESEFVTVNMDDLGDILSKPRSTSPSAVYYARKSDPVAAAARRDVQGQGPISCDQCNKQFKKWTNLQLHIEKVVPCVFTEILNTVPARCIYISRFMRNILLLCR